MPPLGNFPRKNPAFSLAFWVRGRPRQTNYVYDDYDDLKTEESFSGDESLPDEEVDVVTSDDWNRGECQHWFSKFPTSSPSLQAFHVHPKPFILKLKTEQIRICQSCRQDYEGENDTLGLVVAHAERRIISNPATELQFLGKEGNSHYHARMNCIRLADQSFKGQDLVIPEDLKLNLTIFQKFYIATI